MSRGTPSSFLYLYLEIKTQPIRGITLLMIFLENAQPKQERSTGSVMESLMEVQEAVQTFNEDMAVATNEYQELMMESVVEEANAVINEADESEEDGEGKGAKVKAAAVNFFNKIIETVKRIWASVKQFLVKTYTKLNDAVANMEKFAAAHKKEIQHGHASMTPHTFNGEVLLNTRDVSGLVAKGGKLGMNKTAIDVKGETLIRAVDSIKASANGLKNEAAVTQRECKTQLGDAKDGLAKAKKGTDKEAISTARTKVSENQKKLTAQNQKFSMAVRVASALASDATKGMRKCIAGGKAADRAAAKAKKNQKAANKEEA